MKLNDTKGKLIFLFSCFTYCILSLSALVSAKDMNFVSSLTLGFIIIIIGLIFHLVAKKKQPLFYIITSLINPVAMGFYIGAYYSYHNLLIGIWTPIFLLLPFLVIIYTMCLFFSKTKRKAKCVAIYSILFSLLGIICIIFWKRNTLFSLFFFVLVLLTFYLYLCHKNLQSGRSILYDLSFISFGIYILVTYLVLILLSDGDALSFLPDWFPQSHKAKKSN